MSDEEYKVRAFVFCETMAATGAWHIRQPSGPRHLAGIPWGEDRSTLCGLEAAWDVNCEVDEVSLGVSSDRPGHPCAGCKKKYLEIYDG